MQMVFGGYVGRKKFQGYQQLDSTFYSIFQIQSGLINGRGRFYQQNNVDHNGAPLTTYSVKQGKRYRFRVIGTGALYPFRVSVDGHNISVIASDGYDIEAEEAESFIINPGKRFDFELSADQSVSLGTIKASHVVVLNEDM